jgi:Lar family restriction alleviation protein
MLSPRQMPATWRGKTRGHEMNAVIPTLKPCPFCEDGGEPVMKYDKSAYYYVHCDHCEAATWPETNKTAAAANWNSRPIEDALNAKIVALEAVSHERD